MLCAQPHEPEDWQKRFLGGSWNLRKCVREDGGEGAQGAVVHVHVCVGGEGEGVHGWVN